MDWVCLDGASCMRGVNNGVLTKIQQYVPNIIGVHCVAHREALVVCDACEKFEEFSFLDAFANKVHAWVGRSTTTTYEGHTDAAYTDGHSRRRKMLKAFTLKPLEVLQIHNVRWLSRGKVMKRLKMMKLYYMACNFQLQFFIHFMADVLVEMDRINKTFQHDHVDITNIENALDVVIELFRKRYLGEPFGYGCKHYREFLRRINANNELIYVNENGCTENHLLHFTSSSNTNRTENYLESCIALAQKFIQEVICDVVIHDQTHELYLSCLCEKFLFGQNAFVDSFQCEIDVDRFCLQLHKANPSFDFHDAWSHCCHQISWYESFPNLMKIWRALLVIPVSTAACERDFSKQNRIKVDERSSLTLKTLENLMFLSLSSPSALEDVHWNAIYDIWTKMKFRRARHVEI
ncbi:hypothetical protein KP509_26G044600 [Ceratopteris richardii]|uniref:HAT C-terminal dimerisation domain-containing protein n=1 Tax=Ceratopteris richardii TaxID=49495 RepID=A0A8T2RK83_CERRI|nr:hypothetical protein KP509_26G044600 [Ceratopteris richardii]